MIEYLLVVCVVGIIVCVLSLMFLDWLINKNIVNTRGTTAKINKQYVVYIVDYVGGS